MHHRNILKGFPLRENDAPEQLPLPELVAQVILHLVVFQQQPHRLFPVQDKGFLPSTENMMLLIPFHPAAYRDIRLMLLCVPQQILEHIPLDPVV